MGRYMPNSSLAYFSCNPRKAVLSYSIRKNIADLFRGGFFVLPTKLIVFNSVIILIAFFSAKYIPSSLGEPEFWFQRSGALVTLITIWVEIRLLDIISKRDMFNQITELKVALSHHITNFSVTTIDGNKARATNGEDIDFFKAQTKNRANFFNGVIFINLVLGTLIWAYGDLMYININ
jgi:hypothetical protein